MEERNRNAVKVPVNGGGKGEQREMKRIREEEEETPQQWQKRHAHAVPHNARTRRAVKAVSTVEPFHGVADRGDTEHEIQTTPSSHEKR